MTTARPPRGWLVGLRDVAQAAGVSTATVSRVVNTPHLVSAVLRDRVEAVTLKLGWVPHAAARAMTTRRSGAIGAVFPTLSHGDFARAAEALQGALSARGYTLLLACSHYDPAGEYAQVRQFIERGVDAIALVGNVHLAETTALLEARRVPFVNTFNYDTNTPRDHTVPAIGPNNHSAMHKLTRYLLNLGHRRFGMIAQSTHHNDRAAARLQGVRDALAEEGLSVRPQHFVEGQWGIGEGRNLFARIIANSPRLTAIICGNAYLAVGAVLEALDRNIKLPGELSIVGYDDVEIMQELQVPITTLRVRSDEVGRRAADWLIAALANEPAPAELECDVEIVVRASSGPVPPGFLTFHSRTAV